MSDIIITNIHGEADFHRNDHPDYEFTVQKLVPRRPNGKSTVSLYTLPPRKSNYPYHYHTTSEESFYILSGVGILKTPDGEKPVSAGDFIFFPTGESGAHKLTNTSDDENLVYIDFDTCGEIDVCGYPDSGKIGIWGGGFNVLFDSENTIDYYKGE